MVFHAVSSTFSRCNEGAAVPLWNNLNLTLIVFTGFPRPLTHSRRAYRRLSDTPGNGQMLNFLNQTFEVDTYTIVVVALLSGWSGVLTVQVLSRTMLAMVFVPGFIFGALVANYLFEQYAIYPTPDKEPNVVIACTLGMIIALLVLLVVTRISTIVADYRVAHHQFRRS